MAANWDHIPRPPRKRRTTEGSIAITRVPWHDDKPPAGGRQKDCPVPGGTCLHCDDDHCRELR